MMSSCFFDARMNYEDKADYGICRVGIVDIWIDSGFGLG